MFSKLKQIKDLRDQAKKMETLLSAEKVSYSHKGCTVEIDGTFRVTKLSLNEEILSPLKKEDAEKVISELMSEGIKNAQQRIAKRMQELQKSGEIQLPDLSSLS